MDLKIYFQDEANLGKGIRRFFEEQLSLNLKTQTERALPVSAVLKDLSPDKLSDIEAIYFGGKLSDQTFHAEGDESTLEEAEQELDRGKYESILVFGVELSAQTPTRSRLAEITRWLNRKSLGAPVAVIFRYNGKITFANAERTAYVYKNREGEKAGKVSLLKDIDVNKPHAAHRKIIVGDKNTSGLRIDPTKIKSFQALHDYWRKVLNTKELNKDFYNELFKWYLWAKQNVTFPNSKNIDADKHSSESLIRFISRILFVWFMKEKGLVSQKLFDPAELKSILKQFKADDNESNQYYTAVLQNLFFATLNMPVEQRSWISKNKKNPKQDGNPLYYRYEDQFLDAEETIENLFNKVPFLNGGLFDCLDDKKKGIVEDGFTRHKKNQPVFPNQLFFGDEEQADISEYFKDASDKNKWKAVKTKGIISLFDVYKFTIEENTPLEEDIALDPELLGKVFENLLASYNPETGETARKQTGSFYTPREIVNYMVDESLKAYLKNGLLKEENYTEEIIYDFTGKESRRERKQIEGTSESPWLGKEEELNEKLNALFDVHRDVNPFDQESTKEIVELIDHCKILDPACGSGAFPMGILLKLVDVLHKLDPENELWKETQIERVNRLIAEAEGFSDPGVRKQVIRSLKESKNKIEEAFRNNELNYGRKLYLIQNCIYGVDIQPIAIQISKLRFFISLLVDQTEKESEPNRGFEPLPNMDFKLIAANTLIGAPNNEVAETYMVERNLLPRFQQLTKEYFSISDPEEKNNQKEQIAGVIHEIVEVNKNIVRQFQNRLEKEKNTSTAAKQKKYVEQIQNYERDIQNWESFENIFNNESVSFFEPTIFYPEIKDGFDVVIGNPPYVSANNMSIHDRNYFNKDTSYKTLQGKWDLYIAFAEKSLNILNQNGIFTFIIPFGFLNQPFAEGIRTLILNEFHLLSIVDLHNEKIFENATVPSCIPIIQKTNKMSYSVSIRDFIDNNFLEKYQIDVDKYRKTSQHMFRTENLDSIAEILDEIRVNTFPLDELFYISTGAEIHGKESRGENGLTISGRSKFEVLSNTFTQGLKPYIEGSAIKKSKEGRYSFPKIDTWLDYSAPQLMRSPKFPELFDSEKIIIRRSSGLLRILAILDNLGIHTSEKCLIIIKRSTLPLRHSNYNNDSRLSLKYLISILNSKLIDFYYESVYGGFIDVYPNNLKRLPIKVNDQFIPALTQLVDFMLIEKSKQISSIQISLLDSIIDSLILNLYFPDHMKERGIDVLEFVERDIEAVMQGRDFEVLSDPEKEAIIEQLHALWSDPENEVVKRMGMFKERSPEILKVILES
ncbi:putative restriction [Lunatimonas lonarensis]|uniref:site-specific DNA-methyltransferase (adenine-specific) n=1 Tax=Lunatimonas lonarensis TaxID=1232681 RepID=R7ZUA6_9BACT|nr:N-6 DNA methylase [Lunatimonas lonarensis]EON77725.1 putative restriction [Lunatimonas lonarensis]